MTGQTTRDRARMVMYEALSWWREDPNEDVDAVHEALDTAGIILVNTAELAQLEADTRLLRAFVEAYDAWDTVGQAATQAFDEYDTVEWPELVAARAALDAAGVMER